LRIDQNMSRFRMPRTAASTQRFMSGSFLRIPTPHGTFRNTFDIFASSPTCLSQRDSPTGESASRRAHANSSNTNCNSSTIRFLSAQGDPPDLYRVEYYINSLEPTSDPERPAPRKMHQVEIQLTADYPRSAPACKMLTPIYHPNIDASHVCVGDHWAAGERLVDLVVRIGEMLAYQAYNIKSPLDAHAAMWADLNGEKLPTDPRTIRPAELE